MKRAVTIVIAVMIAVLAAMFVAGDGAYWRRYLAAGSDGAGALPAQLVEPRVTIKSGEGGSAPRSTPVDEGFEPAALQEATTQARLAGARALVVRRHGHVVLTSFAEGIGENTEMAGGDFSALPLALVLGTQVESAQLDVQKAMSELKQALPGGGRKASSNPWSTATRTELGIPDTSRLPASLAALNLPEAISERVWQSLHAADAYLWGRSPQALRVDCCMVARMEDWLRLGDLLLQQGSFEGERVVSASWVRRLLAGDGHGRLAPIWVDPARAFTGDEPPAARETLWIDMGPSARLWLLPQRQMSVLYWAAPRSTRPASDTLIPNIIIRGIVDQALPAIGPPALDDLVPGHQ